MRHGIQGGDGVDLLKISQTGRAPIELSLRDPDGRFTLPDGTVFDGIERLDFKSGSGDDRLEGGAFADSLNGGGGDDALVGSADQDLLNGGDGNDHIRTSDDGDRAVGGTGVDTLLGAAGDDRLDGGEGSDMLSGGDGDDRLAGQAGIDTVEGGLGDDVYTLDDRRDLVLEEVGGGRDTLEAAVDLKLNEGAEIETLVALGPGKLTGNEFDQTLKGSAYQDRLDGGAGADTLKGGSHDDVLIGGSGDDRLIGGIGENVFKFSEAFGHDEVADFSAGLDVIGISAPEVQDFGDVMSRADQVGDDVVITIGRDRTITLDDVRREDLTADDFMLG